MVRSPDSTALRGQCIGVELLWRLPLTTFEGKKISLQVLNKDGQLVVQNDQPISPSIPSISRKHLLMLRLSLPIPDNLVPGTYTLVLVVYDPSTLRREMLDGLDHLRLWSFQVP